MSIEGNQGGAGVDALSALRARIEEARTQKPEQKPFMADFYNSLVAFGENRAREAAARRATKRVK